MNECMKKRTNERKKNGRKKEGRKERKTNHLSTYVVQQTLPLPQFKLSKFHHFTTYQEMILDLVQFCPNFFLFV